MAKVGSPPYPSGVSQEFEELEGLHVDVEDVMYMPSLDAPKDRPHPFVYFINIRNNSPERVFIFGRKWLVREEGNSEITVVEGDGVVGQFPEIAPGGVFSYNSYHVTRGAGRAEGSFFGKTESGRQIYVRIPTFRLRLPDER